MTFREVYGKENLCYHHSAYKRGYCRRKKNTYPETEGYLTGFDGFGYAEPYNGKFGVGYVLHIPCWHSTRYHGVIYYIKEV